ncbi:NUDIX hydrolase [Rhizobium sp. TRM96647]|uniref:NUDIX hydrolase n=1 Tax=unclassified Rhizobium TaxID=2613769 RepID=UPI0021E825EF|nr:MULTISPECIES: NUDIX hydrolase [unclassified Rhizobium]MCV3738277.1 NUDIX hydrolase [Rhizobium sp. TRM96647]MCV3759974.1 NUDIX hydrolase [Rhizobium sp. TRM96650]
MSGQRPLRPVDAASVLLIDRSDDRFRVLVGKRSNRHVFMPDVYVFPGGRRDASDSRVPVQAPLHPAATERLLLRTPVRTGAATLRGLGVAALRELYEEAGLAVGAAAEAPGAGGTPFRPDLSQLRFVARAVTPPGPPRRYDTRFFALFTDDVGIDPRAARDSHELSDLQWIDIFQTLKVDMPAITVFILEELKIALRNDPSLPFGGQAAFFLHRRGKLVRDTL